MEKLLPLHDHTDPRTGLHNALAASSLSVEKAEIKGAEATVHLGRARLSCQESAKTPGWRPSSKARRASSQASALSPSSSTAAH